MGLASFTLLILLVTAKIALEARMWTKLFLAITALSLLVYPVTLLVLGSHAVAGLPGLDVRGSAVRLGARLCAPHAPPPCRACSGTWWARLATSFPLRASTS